MSRISQPISASASAFSSPRCSGQGASINSDGAALFRRALRPQLLGDEGHEGMQQHERLVEHESGHGARLGRGFGLAAGEDRLDQLQIPVAIDVPDEMVDRARRLVEAEALSAPR